MNIKSKEKNITDGDQWFRSIGWEVFPFQQKAWDHYLSGYSGLINAPTGFGKTYSLLIPIIIEGLQDASPKQSGIRAIWVAPIRALTSEIQLTCQKALEGLGLDWRVEVRSGDTSTSQRKKQLEDCLLYTSPSPRDRG